MEKERVARLLELCRELPKTCVQASKLEAEIRAALDKWGEHDLGDVLRSTYVNVAVELAQAVPELVAELEMVARQEREACARLAESYSAPEDAVSDDGRDPTKVAKAIAEEILARR